ncbi:TlpA disulfide reductase family protein [Persicobacter psychrovividus]|uniref:Thioredoxin domain-containing protein n=1 Tax=Persicobacter psychrovividus TaxID=387638 RepID=A0ABN6L8B4_9BACT|nr:hypothetical protein PEPS_17050 [Persicobacter psychrovividus]
MKKLLYLFSGMFLLGACNTQNETGKQQIPFGNYRATIHTQHKDIPFQFSIEKKDQQSVVYLINGQEKLPINEFYLQGDSLHLPMHIFENSISAKWVGDHLEGTFKKPQADDYLLPFTAFPNKRYRFRPMVSDKKQTGADFSGKWKTHFSHKADSVFAMGIFKQQGDKVEGTFRTTTGDYRFLAGNVQGDSLYMSAFDGEHLYLFEAQMQGEKIHGEFWSGRGFHTQWTAEKDPEFELPDAYSLTKLTNKNQAFDFSFPDLNNKIVHFQEDARFKGKPTVVQIFGSWCPNCMDETAFIADWYKKNKDRGVEVVAIAFERNDNFEHSKKRVEKVVRKYQATYPFVIGGARKNADAAMPMLEKIKSFPTTIFLDKEGKVYKIHTGFNGPSTGTYYEDYIKHFNETVDHLLQ